jgi:peptidoglycan/LPS O-acetylase OafA/YrhL
LASIIDHDIVAVMTVCLIVGQMQKAPFINLEKPWLDFLGKISFGVYVIHLLLIFYLQFLLKPLGFGIWDYVIVYLVVYATTILCAYISYQYLEKMFIKFKSRFTVVESVSSKS